VPALLDIARGTAETEDQEVAEALFRTGEIVGRVHRAEDFILRYLTVERRDQTCKPIFADGRIHLGIVHAAMIALAAELAGSRNTVLGGCGVVDAREE